MKTFLQKISLFIFTITFFVVTGIPVQAINFPNDYSSKQNFIVESHNAYKDAFGNNYVQQFKKNEIATQNAEKIQDAFDKDESGEIIYPDYIGGIYINDNDDLVVQLVEENTQKMKLNDLNRYNKIMAVNMETKYEQVNYSYNELEEIRKSIEKEFADGKLKGIVNMLYLDIINNSVVVSLKEYSEENIDLVKDLVTNPNALTFYNEVNISTSASEKKAGSPLSTSVGGCSLGYKVKYVLGLPSTGMLTAGHCVKDNEKITGYGTVTKIKFGGAVDAAYIKFDSSVATPSDYLHQYSGYNIPTGKLGQTSTSYVTGQKVARVGASSKLQAGKVTAINVSLEVDMSDLGVLACMHMTDQVLTDVKQVSGDSGGVVYLTSNLFVMGLGTISVNGKMAFSRADKISTELGVLKI